jgi:hypothetical protein
MRCRVTIGRFCRGAALVLALILNCGGATAAARKARFPMTQERLAARVEVFWKAWQAHDLHRIFLVYAPSYRRKTVEPAFYELTRGMLGIDPVEYKLSKIEMSKDGSRATLILDAQTVIPPLGQVPNKLVQHWVYEEGDWYKLMDSSSSPVPPPGRAQPAPTAEPPPSQQNAVTTPAEHSPAAPTSSQSPAALSPHERRSPTPLPR